MAKLKILTYPDPRLRKKATPVVSFGDETAQIADDLLETMYEAKGIGLAATQADIQKAILVVDISADRDRPQCLINPEIIESHGVEEMEEGCLSVPGIHAKVRRAERIRVRAQDRDGAAQEFTADGLLAVCIQHEMDHLRGKLFVDYLSPENRRRVLEEVKRIKRTGKVPVREEVPYELV